MPPPKRLPPLILNPVLAKSPTAGSASGWRRVPPPLDASPAANVTSLLLVGRDSAARAVALGAARLAYPQAGVTEFPSVADAARRPPLPEAEILVLLRPSAAEIEQATQARDARNLPRWAVVVFGESRREDYSAQIVSPEDWSPRLGAQALSSAAALYRLAHDNERLRGDLRTLGRRINHDLRSPLNCVSTSGEGLRALSSDPASPTAQLTQPLLAAVDEVVALIERVSFVLKATTDGPLPERVPMQPIVWAALLRLESRMRRQDVHVTQPESWPEVDGVAAWLEVIWGNLLENSLKHGGVAPHIELGWTAENHQHRFWIRDDGVGVDEKKRAQLFEPFDRLHELHAPSGLGLPIVQRLVELQGGRCGYESSPGGHTFFFTLPRQSTPAGSPPDERLASG